MSRALSVEFLDDYRIAVALESGSSFVYDLGPKLKTMRFAPLRDVELCKREEQGQALRGPVANRIDRLRKVSEPIGGPTGPLL